MLYRLGTVICKVWHLLQSLFLLREISSWCSNVFKQSLQYKSLVSSVESQKGAINIQRCSVENQMDAITVQAYVIAPFWFSTDGIIIHYLSQP